MRYCLALDAKNLGVVLKDADLENAVTECVLGSLSYNGQRCTALKLLLVHKVPLRTTPQPPNPLPLPQPPFSSLSPGHGRMRPRR